MIGLRTMNVIGLNPMTRLCYGSYVVCYMAQLVLRKGEDSGWGSSHHRSSSHLGLEVSDWASQRFDT